MVGHDGDKPRYAFIFESGTDTLFHFPESSVHMYKQTR